MFSEFVPERVGAFDLPPIEVVRGVTIKGRLVDTEDRPVAGVKLFGLAENRNYGFAITEPNGDFTTSSVPACTTRLLMGSLPRTPMLTTH